MKICVSATDKNLNAMVDQRFGRSKYFIIVDPDSMNFESVSNKSFMASGGAGIQAAQLVINKGVKIVITGNVGPNAFQTLSAAGIMVFTGLDGTVKEAIEKHKKGELKVIKNPNVNSHFGMRANGKKF